MVVVVPLMGNALNVVQRNENRLEHTLRMNNRKKNSTDSQQAKCAEQRFHHSSWRGHGCTWTVGSKCNIVGYDKNTKRRKSAKHPATSSEHL